MTNERAWNAYENRCDSCGAESWFHFERLEAVGKNDTRHQDFFFCGHHGRKFEPALTEQGWDHMNYTEFINTQPSISANAVGTAD